MDALLQSIYQGPLEERPWQSFLELFRQAVEANFATLLLRPPREGDTGVVLNALVIAPTVYSDYQQTYFALDPFVDLPPGEVVTLREFVPRDELLASEYFQQYIGPVGVMHIMGADMSDASGLNARLRVTRPGTQPDFGEAEKALCRLILPHLQHSIALHARLSQVESERAVFADAIERLAMGVLILDEDARVVRSNRAAETLLAAHEGLRVGSDGLLQVGDRQQNRAFRQLLDEVLSAHRSAVPGFVRALRLGSADGGSGLGLLVRPLPRAAATDSGASAQLAVFISDPGQRRLAPTEVLAELFGFTAAEAALALRLANGLTLDEASSELGVSRNTAKSHLSAVFAKTGVARQTKLVQLILKSVAPIGGAPAIDPEGDA